MYRAGSWNGRRWTGTPLLQQNPVFTYDFVSNEKEVFYLFDDRNRSVPSRLVVTASGDVQHFTGIDVIQTWARFSIAAFDRCNKYAVCGSYASCKINKSPAVCECLEGFTLKSLGEWEILDWTEGFVRMAPLHCNHSNGFLKQEEEAWLFCLVSTVDLAYPRGFPQLVLRNGSALRYRAGSWNGIRFTGTPGLNPNQGLLYRFELNKDEVYYEVDDQDDGNATVKKLVGIIVGSVIMIVILLVGLIFYIHKRKLKKQGIMKRKYKMTHSEGEKEEMDLWIFDFNTISKATDNFSNDNKLGEGGFGPVYK
ncbi:hypothetical protein Ddye_027091, partial [Dipteronia dyeriana]